MFRNETGPDVGENIDEIGENNQSLEASCAVSSTLVATAPVFTFSGSSGAQVTNTSLSSLMSTLFVENHGQQASSNPATSTPRGSSTSRFSWLFGTSGASTSDTNGFASSLNHSQPPTSAVLDSLNSGVEVVFVPTDNRSHVEALFSRYSWPYSTTGDLPRLLSQADSPGSPDNSYGECPYVGYETAYSSLSSSTDTVGGLGDQNLDVAVSNPVLTNNGNVLQEPPLQTFLGQTPSIANSVSGFQSHPNIPNPANIKPVYYIIREPVSSTFCDAISNASNSDALQAHPNASNAVGTNTDGFPLQEHFPTSFAATSIAASNSDSHEHKKFPAVSNPAGSNTVDFALQEPTSFATTSSGALTEKSTHDFSSVIGPGTSAAKYVPVKGFEKVTRHDVWTYGTKQIINWRLHCIAVMNAYKQKSLEELRLEDYAAGRKGSRHSDLATKEMTSLVESIEEVWRCPVCLDRVCAPVKMCENGHISCAKCNRQPRCPLCRARFSPVPLRALEQVLDLLPKKCRHAQLGCGTLHPLDQMQYCVYRTMRCFGPCSWEGAVKDWWAHAQSEHPAFEASQPITITHRPNSPEFYCLKSDEELFLFRIHAENGLAHCCARHIPTAKPTHKFAFEVVIRKDGSLLRSAIIKASKDLFDIHRMSVLTHEVYFADVVIALQKSPV